MKKKIYPIFKLSHIAVDGWLTNDSDGFTKFKNGLFQETLFQFKQGKEN